MWTHTASRCAVRFGVRADLLYHPDANWKEFYEQISVLNDAEQKVWCSVKKSPVPWINLAQLKSIYSHNVRSDNKVDAGDACCVIAWNRSAADRTGLYCEESTFGITDASPLSEVNPSKKGMTSYPSSASRLYTACLSIESPALLYSLLPPPVSIATSCAVIVAVSGSPTITTTPTATTHKPPLLLYTHSYCSTDDLHALNSEGESTALYPIVT